ncbi:hypothetical protein CJ010_08505 [Azoarcus sp. DD4]|uniref:bifunctional diguanylate cyclase/phosphodiesterase n=1 Tax=Azoarcus sp. DD4 TaxID=2027405 RepID=UPI00112ACEDE|nr:EAL domain-containing protein [Azoarcus sp. DD4]QDF96568.1 hypothetical protein CJ010_08505 [Azoarcus sp. DD4]
MLLLVLLMTGTVALLSALQDSRDLELRLAAREAETLATYETHLRNQLVGLADYLEFQRARSEERARAIVREQVDLVFEMATAIYEREHGRLPEERIRTLIIEAIRPMRFLDGRGYYFIDTLDGRCVLLPISPEREGSSLWDNRDDSGHYIMRGLIDAARNPQGAGFSRYRWYRPDNTETMAEKIAYVRRFEPFDWIIGAGEYIYKIEADLQREALKRIESQRFQPDGVIGVATPDGHILVEPHLSMQPLPQHARLEQTPEPHWTQAAREIIAQHGGGRLQFTMKTADGRSERRLAYAVEHAGWGWHLVASIGLAELDAALERERADLHRNAAHRLRLTLALLALASLVTVLFGLALSGWLTRRFAIYRTAIAERNATLEENNRELQLASRVFECGNEAMMVLDASHRYLAVNSAFTQMVAVDGKALEGRPVAELFGTHDGSGWPDIERELASVGAWSGEVCVRRTDRTELAAQLSISAVTSPAGKATHFVGALTDMTGHKQTEALLRHMAEYDALTDLPNRVLLRDRARLAIQSAAQSGRLAAMLFIDLDRFKNVNDSLGHSVGDALLRLVAQRLSGLVSPSDTISRPGGDEFVVLLTDLASREDIAAQAARIIAAFASAFRVDHYELSVTPSVGIAVWPHDGVDADTLLRNADAAMYHAKESGRNTYRFFTSEMSLQVRERLDLENLLRQALMRDEFEVHYQPQFSLADQRILGCEALIRWRHPERGLVPPDRFIPLAEDTGLIVAIGRWVLAAACTQARLWQDAGLGDIPVAVNASPVQIHHGNFAETVAEVLTESGLPARLLEIELTESTLMADAAPVAATLTALQNAGVRLAIDDFGTGYSSLAYLKRFKLDKLKIDRSFINDLPGDVDDANITVAIIGIARSLGMGVIAEGVETPEQQQFLLERGCGEGQGYLFSRPLTAEAMTALLRRTAAIDT